MPLQLRRSGLMEIVRYYQAGVVNTLFGLGCYALLVRLGLNMYVAQLVAHLLGMAFNYITYSRHVFRSAGSAKLRFLISYAVNYLLSVGILALLANLIASPYIAGALTTFLVSIVNFFVLKLVVFRARAE